MQLLAFKSSSISVSAFGPRAVSSLASCITLFRMCWLREGCFSSWGSIHSRAEKRISNMTSMLTFKEAWTKSIWPTVRPKYEQLLTQRPAEQGLEEYGAVGGHVGKKVLTKCAEKGECRNVSCNLCWTDPTENTPMQ